LAIARVAATQHGAVARWQLLALGMDRNRIRRWIRAGRLHIIYRGVYAIGHRALSPRGRLMAAALYAGRDAALICRTAGALWSLRPYSGQTEVASLRQLRAPRGLRIRRVALRPDEITTLDGIPVTTVARTLFDLAAVLQPHQLDRALEQAELQHRFDLTPLVDLLNRYPRRKGTRALRNAIDAMPSHSGHTRGDLEALWRSTLLAENLPTPILNATLELNGTRYEPDALWPDHKVAVELDSRAFHDTSQAFERDRERDRILTAAGFVVIRVTWRQLTRDRRRVVDDFAALLGDRRRAKT
jgi:hypothetical protein